LPQSVQAGQSRTKTWWNLPSFGEPNLEGFPKLSRKWRISAVFDNWHGACKFLDMADGWPGRPGSGRLKMTLSYISLQQIAVSIIGAVVASSLFLTAAAGPVSLI